MSKYKDKNLLFSQILIDENSTADCIYIGYSTPSLLTSEDVWMIKRYSSVDNSIKFADGSNNFNKIWDNRTTYTYS